jgi:hypothetical protein
MALGGILSVIVVSIGIITWMLREWPAPMVPLFVMGSALVVIYLVLGIAWMAVSKRELAAGVGAGGENAEERALKRLVGLVLQVMFGLAALGMFAFWIVPDVRVATLNVFKERGPYYVIQALNDPNPKVVIAACQNLFELGTHQYEPYIVDGLTRVPEAAAPCLTWAAERDLGGHIGISLQLARQWESRILTAAHGEAPRVCPLITAHQQVSTISNLDDPIPFALQCAVTATSSSIRSCCSESLASVDYRKPPASYPEETLSYYPELVSLSFRPTTVSPEDQAVAARLSLTSNASRQWVLELGCELMGSANPRQVIRGLMPLVESSSCNLSEAGRLMFTQTAPWMRLCGEVANFSPQADVESSLCHGFQEALAATSVAAASEQVHLAIVARATNATAQTLDDGGLGARLERKQEFYEERSTREIASYIHKGGKANPHSNRCQRSRLNITSPGGPVIMDIFETTDCEQSWKEGKTIGEVHRNMLRIAGASKKVKETGGGHLAGTSNVRATAEQFKRARENMKRKAQESK